MIHSSNNKCVNFLATDRVNLYTCGNYVVFKVSFIFFAGWQKKHGVCLCGESVLFIIVLYNGVARTHCLFLSLGPTRGILLSSLTACTVIG